MYRAPYYPILFVLGIVQVWIFSCICLMKESTLDIKGLRLPQVGHPRPVKCLCTLILSVLNKQSRKLHFGIRRYGYTNRQLNHCIRHNVRAILVNTLRSIQTNGYLKSVGVCDLDCHNISSYKIKALMFTKAALASLTRLTESIGLVTTKSVFWPKSSDPALVVKIRCTGKSEEITEATFPAGATMFNDAGAPFVGAFS